MREQCRIVEAKLIRALEERDAAIKLRAKAAETMVAMHEKIKIVQAARDDTEKKAAELDGRLKEVSHGRDVLSSTVSRLLGELDTASTELKEVTAALFQAREALDKRYLGSERTSSADAYMGVLDGVGKPLAGYDDASDGGGKNSTPAKNNGDRKAFTVGGAGGYRPSKLPVAKTDGGDIYDLPLTGEGPRFQVYGIDQRDALRQVFFDVETTGLSHRQGHRIVEVAAIEMRDRCFTGKRIHFYIDPEMPVDPRAERVHGLSNSFLRGKPKFAQIADELCDFIHGAELVAHNASFDVGFMNAELSRLCLPEVEKQCRVLDTLKLARKLHPNKKNSLDALCERYGVSNGQRNLHGAMLDAELLAKVYLEMTVAKAAKVIEFFS